MAVNNVPDDTAEGDDRDWLIYRGHDGPHDGLDRLPPPPPWRDFSRSPNQRSKQLAVSYRPGQKEIEMVNAALHLRRPLLVTGPPGTGKSTLAASIAYELGIGPVLRWPISSRSTLDDGLYRYDAIGRLHEVNMRRDGLAPESGSDPEDIGRFIRLGPLGTALLPRSRPRALLIDEIDKGDIDLPNDLLNVFEEGEFTIPEILRLGTDKPIKVLPYDSDRRVSVPRRGKIRCRAFPVVVMTSNKEREFPPAFLRRCLQLDIKKPQSEQLREIAEAHFGTLSAEDGVRIQQFSDSWGRDDQHATDQLLNALALVSGTTLESGARREPGPLRRDAAERVTRPLDQATD